MAAKITGEPLESDVPKAASQMVVKLLIQTPVKEVPDAIVQLLKEMAKNQAVEKEPADAVKEAGASRCNILHLQSFVPECTT